MDAAGLIANLVTLEQVATKLSGLAPLDFVIEAQDCVLRMQRENLELRRENQVLRRQFEALHPEMAQSEDGRTALPTFPSRTAALRNRGHIKRMAVEGNNFAAAELASAV